MVRVAAFLVLFATAATAAGESVVAGLSQNRISITADFRGSGILVYGAVKRDAPAPASGPLEVIVTVQGPSAPTTVRRKSRVLGIWINTAKVAVDSAPSFYDVATTGPLAEILSQTEDLRHRISVPLAIRSVGAPQNIMDSQSFTEALIRLRTQQSAYRLNEGGVSLSEETLFRADIALPANLVQGNYTTRIFLLRNKHVVDLYSQTIYVRKVGLERLVFNLAHKNPAAYGALALMLAAFAGWAASALFRLIRT
jgi:uncharacterized protein (TIGR02186 family)